MDTAQLRTKWAARARMSRGERTRVVVAALLLAAAAVAIVAHYRAPGSLYSLAVTSAAPFLCLASIPAAVLFLRVGRPTARVGAALCIVPIAWLAVVQAPTFVAQTAPPGVDVQVMTANLKVGHADPHAVISAVRNHDVAVLMVEELTPAERTAFDRDGLDRLLPYSIADTAQGGAGTGIWSRYPFHHTRVATAEHFGFVTTRVQVPRVSTPTTLVAMHMYGPHPTVQFPGWQQDMRRYPQILRSLPKADVIVGGDFNATADAAQFRAFLAGGYADAAAQAGAGFTPTWPADRWYPPMIAIDHVLTRGAVATAADTVEIPGSDHRALVVTVRVPPKG